MVIYSNIQRAKNCADNFWFELQKLVPTMKLDIIRLDNEYVLVRVYCMAKDITWEDRHRIMFRMGAIYVEMQDNAEGLFSTQLKLDFTDEQ